MRLNTLTRRRPLLHALLALPLLAGCAAHAGAFDDFFSAIRRDDDGAMRDLLARGVDPNTVDDKGSCGLLLAISKGSNKVAQVLVNAPGIKVALRNDHDESPLMMAAIKGQVDLAKILIDKDADVNKPGWTPLHYAASKGSVPMIELLLDNDAYIDAESPNHSTPLMMAAMYGSEDAVRTLLDAGADPTLKNELGLSAIDFAKRAERPAVAELIAAAVRSRAPKTW